MFSVFDADSVKHFRPKPLQKHPEKVACGPYFGPQGAYSLGLVKLTRIDLQRSVQGASDYSERERVGL